MRYLAILFLSLFAFTASAGTITWGDDAADGWDIDDVISSANLDLIKTEVDDNDGRTVTNASAITGKQASDSDLTTISGLTATTGNVMIGVGSAWGSVAQPFIDCTNCTNLPGGTSPFTDGSNFIHPTVATKDLGNDNAGSNWSILNTGVATFVEINTPDDPGNNGYTPDDNPIGSMPAAPPAGRLGLYPADDGYWYKRAPSDPIPFRMANVMASGAEPLATAAIASGACSTADTSLTATGVVSTDTITWTPSGDISGVTGYEPVTSGGLIIYPYPGTDVVSFKVCNPTTSSITPGAVTVNWKVIR